MVTLAVTLLGGVNVRAASATTTTVTFWIQTMDSCQQAIPGASYTLKGNKITYKAGPGPGTKPVTVNSGQGCPLQRGNCVTVPTGCVSFVLPVPASGTSKVYYTGTQSVTPSGYVPCTGGSACRKEYIKLTVFPTGAMTATVTNVYPDGYTLVWPTGSHYTGAQTDPAVFHSFGLGTISCDGDADADDHLTGSPSTHCDSEAD
jgi:hypothetical protein